MAEFCVQCAADHGFEPDFKGLTSERDWKRGLASMVICEGCGYIQVDPDGACASGDCLEDHTPPRPWHVTPWWYRVFVMPLRRARAWIFNKISLMRWRRIHRKALKQQPFVLPASRPYDPAMPDFVLESVPASDEASQSERASLETPPSASPLPPPPAST